MRCREPTFSEQPRHTMASQFPFFPRPSAKSAAFNIDHAFQQALSFHRSGQLQNAANLYQQILQRQPAHAGSLNMLGVVAFSSGAHADAKRLLSEAVRLLPQDAGARVNLALALTECGEPQAALDRIEEALTLNPSMPAALMNRVPILVKAGRYEEALQRADELIAAGNSYSELEVNRGIALLELGRIEEAIHCLEKVLQTSPEHINALNGLARAHLTAEQTDSAIQYAERAIKINPTNTDAYFTKAQAMVSQGNLKLAAIELNQAVQQQPRNPQILETYANCLAELHEYKSAMEHAEKALAINPKNAKAYWAGGKAAAGLLQHADAIENYKKALDINPELKEVHISKAISEIELKDYASAIQSLKHGNATPLEIQVTLMPVCDWHAFGDISKTSYEDIVRKSTPFPILAIIDDPELHLNIARSYLSRIHCADTQSRNFPKRTAEKLKIGYFSADFCNHATMCLMSELFESHDRDNFEIYAFSYGSSRKDAIREKVIKNVHEFHDVSDLTDQEAAALSRSRNIDIAIDLKGFTIAGRIGIFAERCAPIQVSYLGYPGTTGADYMDYVVADKVVLPAEIQPFFTEKVVYMPHSYQVNDSQRAIASKKFTRAELGLPDDAFVFCCFNNNYKILPDTLDGWIRILNAVPNSVLWLFKDNDAAAENLAREAQERGLAPERLIFAPRFRLDEHLARHAAADLFIDTLPCNAHTTTSDALWAGLPVLTQAGRSFAARVAASLLTAVGLPELITTSQAEYEAMAIRLATHPDELKALRDKLQVQRVSSPLFDGKRFTRDLETAYRMMLERYEAGLPPAPISVPASV